MMEKSLAESESKFMNKTYEDNVAAAMEFRLKHKAGHWIDFESRCMPVMNENHVIEHIVMISRDISERKKAEEFLSCSQKNYPSLES
jgi:PAS domain S-box-containing protein